MPAYVATLKLSRYFDVEIDAPDIETAQFRAGKIAESKDDEADRANGEFVTIYDLYEKETSDEV